MALQAMWVRGNSVRPEKTDPTNLKDFDGVKWSALLGIPKGSGCTFRGLDNTSNWFHFSIPTPVIVNGSSAKLDKFFVLFRGKTSQAVIRGNLENIAAFSVLDSENSFRSIISKTIAVYIFQQFYFSGCRS